MIYTTTYFHGTDGEGDYSEHDVNITFSYRAGTEPIIHRLPEDCDPGSGPEIEIENIECDWSGFGDWHEASKDLAKAVTDWCLDSQAEEMSAAAEDDLQAQHDDYMEQKAEAQAEARAEDW